MEDIGSARDGAGSAPARGAGGHSNNNNRNGGRFGRGSGRGNHPHTTPFKGADSTLGVFDVVSRGGDNGQFAKCLKLLVLFVGRTFLKFTTDYKTAVQTLRLDMPTADPDDAAGLIGSSGGRWTSRPSTLVLKHTMTSRPV